jgi:hypothetical protein
MMLERYARPLTRCGFWSTFVLLVLTGTPFAQDKFTPACPLEAINQKRPIDAQCGPDGKAGQSQATTAQNSAKNDLCAPGPAVPVTISIFDDLQQAAEEKEISFGNQHVPHPVPLPDDRSALKDLAQTSDGTKVGEGTEVIFVGFVRKTKQGGAESVNCDATGKAANDIHIVLAKKFDDPECSSVTAEMIPHFRPAAWDKITFQSVMAKLVKHPVRTKGQMFFDASHSPCGHPEFLPSGDPSRRSLWEIHPVYAMDVCKNKTLAGCKIDKESVWTPLDVWVKHPQ